MRIGRAGRSRASQWPAYARRQGFDADAAYRWKRILRRGGAWIEDAPLTCKAMPPPPAVKFARVALNDSARPASMLLQISLSHGRRAELDLQDVSQLGAVIAALEQAG